MNSRTSNDLNFRKSCHLKVLKSFTFWAGGLAGVVSAAATHQLDVAKTSLESGNLLKRDLDRVWKGDGKVMIFMTRWWQLKYFIFSSLLGEDFQFDAYFSDGLVQPPPSHDDMMKWWNPFFPPTWGCLLILPYRMTTICCSNVPERICSNSRKF